MAVSADLIDFDIIETQKENIQALPSGRSAKSLAQLYSPVPGVTSPAQTQDVHSSIRKGYEQELSLIDESDDPLDIYDRYVRWTLNAYPSNSATPQSQLLPLLERATKAFLKADHYKNDPRYLKIWLHYINLFSDAPRETFSFLARNKVGEGLALFYEEFAAWLEGAGRWIQAEEIYKLGIEREARPVERLVRKFGEFEQRAAAKPEGLEEPSSPALPIVRPALAAKLDPFAVTSPPAADPQAASRNAQPSSRKQKLQIFSDDGQESRPSSGEGGRTWDSIGTLADRRKENTRAPQPWTGETLNAGSQQNVGVQKMTIFKDKSVSHASMPYFSPNHPARSRQVVNERTGRVECVFVNLEAVYPNPADPSEEYCFEELRAAKRGWLHRDWSRHRKTPVHKKSQQSSNRELADTTTTLVPLSGGDDDDKKRNQLSPRLQCTIHMNDENNPSSTQPQENVDAARRFRREERANRTRKIKAREVKSETQTIQTNLDSPRGPKLKRKKAAEPTMTLQTKAATDEIYALFNQTLTLGADPEEDEESASETDDDGDDEEDDYTSAGESTGTGRISGATSEYGEETQGELTQNAEPTQNDSGEEDSGWSEFTTSKHMPKDEDDETGTNFTASSEREDVADHGSEPLDIPEQRMNTEESEDEVATPTSPTPAPSSSRTFVIPIPPEGYDAPTRPYRDAAQVAANRLPFMTPIVEKTESSMGTATAHKEKDYFSSKTPCPKAGQKSSLIADSTADLLSSPFQERLNIAIEDDPKIVSPELARSKYVPVAPVSAYITEKKDATRKGPIIADAQCNPMDPTVQKTILSEIQPPLQSFEGYFEHRDTSSNRKMEIKKYCKGVALAKSGKCGSDKAASMLGSAPNLCFEGAKRQYRIKRELGAGAYAPVYLVENADVANDGQDGGPVEPDNGRFKLGRRRLEALKMEEPPSAWEFYMLRTIHRRLGVMRAADSIIQAYEMHLFKDEGYLVEEYQDQGTLLDLVNAFSDHNRASGGHSGLDEALAMFFTVELLRTVEAMHAKGVIHGDLKPDNVLVRLSTPSLSAADDEMLPVQYSRDGTCGWSAKGIKLIDFGRGIDMRAFEPNVQFIADWQTSTTDCAEMRELRPWTFHTDYHGVAAIAHTMLFGKYIETVAEKSGGVDMAAGAGKQYKLKEGLKRYWQTDIWGELFALMLNPGRHLELEEGQRLPCTRGVKAVKERMEKWLESNGEKGGVGLRSLIRRAEALTANRKKM